LSSCAQSQVAEVELPDRVPAVFSLMG